MKRVVYTCIVGDIDVLKDPHVADPDTKYICYTDRAFKSHVWDIRPLLFQHTDPRLTARMHKTLAHQHEDVPVMWQDGKITFLKSQLPLFETLGKHAIALIPHPRRSCVLPEAHMAAELYKVDLSQALAQVNGYFNVGFPPHWGLFETAILIRNPAKCIALNVSWWAEISTKTCRDQLSLPYLLWSQKVDYALLDVPFLDNDIFFVRHHPYVNNIKFG